MSAFDNINRVVVGPASHLVGQFDYLNSSARPEAERVRSIIDDMLSRYPIGNRQDLIRRIRSRHDGLHDGAIFELILHELLIRQGFRVVAIEPKLPNGRSPDFLVEAPDDSSFYLEATLAQGESGADPGADRRFRDALQAIDDVVSPDFFLRVHHSGLPASQVAVGRLRRDVQSFVDRQDHQSVSSALERDEPYPAFEFDHDGLSLRIELQPKNTRIAGGRSIGMRMGPARAVAPHLAIKSAIKHKAGHYGELDRPYVIAVNAFDQFADAGSVIDALFGSPTVAIRQDGEARFLRNADGAWQEPAGPVNTRVSAVLSTERLSAWSLGQRSMRLIHNPWAARPLPDIPLGVETRQVVDEALVETPGSSLREILKLPEGWPE